MQIRQAHHPLRHLMVNGNGNKKRNSGHKSADPLIEYLQNHNIDPDAFNAYVQSVNCEVITPFSCDYDTARKESDNAFDKFPLIIAMTTCTADVVNTMKFCRAQNIEICLRAGGHNTAGYSVLDARMLIDVSNIKGISVDPEEMESTVGAGVQWGEYNHELDAWGLHNPGGSCSSVGLTGYTLGGGYGYTSMRWGICSDNLLQVTMVTAEGEIIIANHSQNEDILWACQGGTGGNFGVVVELRYRLYKLKMVWPIQVNWPIKDAAELLTVWQNEMTKDLVDRDLGILGFLAARTVKSVNAQGEECTVNEPYFCIRGVYTGEDSKAGAKALQPLLAIGSPTYPAEALWKEQISYGDCNETLLDNVEGVIPDTINETKRCAYINDPLTQADYQRMIDYFKTSPSVYNIVSMEPYGGAINEVEPDATAFVHRNGYFNIFTDSFWMPDSDPKVEEAAKKEAFKWLWDYYESKDTKDLWSTNYYQNYPNSLYTNWQEGYFDTNYPRLRKIKLKWDPKNIFHFEQSIELP